MSPKSCLRCEFDRSSFLSVRVKVFGASIGIGLFLVATLSSSVESKVQDLALTSPSPMALPYFCQVGITNNQSCTGGTYTTNPDGSVYWSGVTSTTFNCAPPNQTNPVNNCAVCSATTVSTSTTGASFAPTGNIYYASSSGACNSQGNVATWGENQGPLDPTLYYQLKFYSTASGKTPCNQIAGGSYTYFGQIIIGIPH